MRWWISLNQLAGKSWITFQVLPCPESAYLLCHVNAHPMRIQFDSLWMHIETGLQRASCECALTVLTRWGGWRRKADLCFPLSRYLVLWTETSAWGHALWPTDDWQRIHQKLLLKPKNNNLYVMNGNVFNKFKVPSAPSFQALIQLPKKDCITSHASVTSEQGNWEYGNLSRVNNPRTINTIIVLVTSSSPLCSSSKDFSKAKRWSFMSPIAVKPISFPVDFTYTS